MARATQAVMDVDEALRARDLARANGQPDPQFTCTECGQPVHPHAASSYGEAHFEHLDRNTDCSQSDPPR